MYGLLFYNMLCSVVYFAKCSTVGHPRISCMQNICILCNMEICILCTYYSIYCRNSMSSIVVWHSQHVSDSITPIHLNTLMYTRLHYFNTTMIYFHTLNLVTTSPKYHKINKLTGISLHNICTQKDIFNTVLIPQPNYFLIVLSISNLSNFKIHFKDV